MLTLKHLEDERDKLLTSKEAYEKQLQSAKDATERFESELLRHAGALWQIDQLIALMSKPAPDQHGLEPCKVDP